MEFEARALACAAKTVRCEVSAIARKVLWKIINTQDSFTNFNLVIDNITPPNFKNGHVGAGKFNGFAARRIDAASETSNGNSQCPRIAHGICITLLNILNLSITISSHSRLTECYMFLCLFAENYGKMF